MTNDNPSLTRPTSQAEVPLIPREVLFGNPERTSPQLSPDGHYLAYLAPDEHNVLQVWLRTVGHEDDRVLTADKKRGIRMYFWTFDEEQLIYMQDADGDENWHLYTINITTNNVRDLTPYPGIQARMVALDHKFPHDALVALNLRDASKHDVYHVNLQNGDVELRVENPGNIVGWTPDPQLQVRAATAMTADGGWDLLLRDSEASEWRVARHWGHEDEGHAAAFSEDGRTLFVIGSHEANAQRLLALDVASGQETIIAEDPQYDVGSILMHPTQHRIQAVAFNRDKVEWEVLDEGIIGDIEAITEGGDDFWIGTRNLADRTWLIGYFSDTGPTSYYVYDRSIRERTFLFTDKSTLEELPLAPMQPITYEARDGLTIHGYLTTPVEIEPKQLPTVLLVHGGPWGRDNWGFSAIVQWLANRGYAVLQVNFRGSTGYGKAFLNAGNREWAAKMHDDLIDGVNWIVQQDVADPKRIAIMGGSYGGYATLVGLTFTPDVFAAGVDIVGPSNLLTLIRSIPPYWAPMKALFARRIGDIETEEEFLRSRSPLFICDRIQVPLLIGQGANDPRVKQAESEQIVDAMRGANKPVEYVLYGDEGHGFARPENRLHFFAIAEEFLTRHLGGRFEPMNNIPGHSGVIK